MNEPMDVYEKALVEAMAFGKKARREAKNVYEKALAEAKNLYDKELAKAGDEICNVYYRAIIKTQTDCGKPEFNLALAKMVWDMARGFSIEAECGVTDREIANRAITELKDEFLGAEKNKEEW
jgi:hypothetical protein